MTRTLEAVNSGVIVPLSPSVQYLALDKLDALREAGDSSLTIGPMLGVLVAKGLEDGIFELDKQTQKDALKMLAQKRLELGKPSLTINEMYSEIVTQAIKEFKSRQQVPADCPPPQQLH